MTKGTGPVSVEPSVPWTFVIKIIVLQRIENKDLVGDPFSELFVPNVPNLCGCTLGNVDGTVSEGVLDDATVRHRDLASVVWVVDCDNDITMACEVFGEKRVLCAEPSPAMVE
jgi:hypothetical protein